MCRVWEYCVKIVARLEQNFGDFVTVFLPMFGGHNVILLALGGKNMVEGSSVVGRRVRFPNIVIS